MWFGFRWVFFLDLGVVFLRRTLQGPTLTNKRRGFLDYGVIQGHLLLET